VALDDSPVERRELVLVPSRAVADAPYSVLKPGSGSDIRSGGRVVVLHSGPPGPAVQPQ
jgi:hypothetical protein